MSSAAAILHNRKSLGREDFLRQPQSIHDSSQIGITAISVHGTEDSLHSCRNHLVRGVIRAPIEDNALVEPMMPADFGKVFIVEGSLANGIPVPLSNPCQYDSFD